VQAGPGEPSSLRNAKGGAQQESLVLIDYAAGTVFAF